MPKEIKVTHDTTPSPFFTEIESLVKALRLCSGRMSDKIQEDLQPFNEIYEKRTGILRPLTVALAPFVGSVARYTEICAPIFLELNAMDKLKEVGILPHRTTPWSEFSKDNIIEFPVRVLEYYHNNWQAVASVLSKDIETYEISDSAKQYFHEALACHGHGLYRSSILTLFPAIEMEYRSACKIKVGSPASSLPELIEFVEDSPSLIGLRDIPALDLFPVLVDHLYKSVKKPEDMKYFKNSPLPNRHAAIHGLIRYHTVQHSLNSIIIADYAFFLFSELSKSEYADKE